MDFDIELKDVKAFIRVANVGSLNATALKYDMPKSTLSHHIRRLEDTVGVELFVRSARNLKLTEAGREFLRYCKDIVESCNSACADIQNLENAMAGKFRVKIYTEFGSVVVGPVLVAIAREFQSLEIEVLSLTGLDVLDHEMDFDCLVYVGNPPDSDLVGALLSNFTYKLYASPKYLENHPVHKVSDLNSHSCICSLKNGHLEDWRLQLNNRPIDIPLSPKIVADDYWIGKYFAIESMGIVYLPEFFVQNELRTGALVPVLEQYKSGPVPIYALFPKQRHQSPKVRLFIDHCTRVLSGIDDESTPYTLASLESNK